MSIKGLREALAKKQPQQQPDITARDGTDPRPKSTAAVRVGVNKPQKKVTGRGR